MSGRSDDELGFFEDKRARVIQYFKDVKMNTKHLFEPWNHTTMFVAISWLSAIVLIVGVVADKTVLALDACDDDELSRTFRCNPTEVPKELAHIKERQDATYYYAGLWTVDYGGEEGTVCDDWPNGGTPNKVYTDLFEQSTANDTLVGIGPDWEVCGSIKLVRGLYTAAIALLIVGAIPGTFFLYKNSVDPDFKAFGKVDITLYLLLVSSGLTCAGYWIYQEKVHAKLEEQLKLAVHTHVATVGRYYSTLGYSYALPLWSWLWTPVVFLTKMLFNHLDVPHHDGEGEPEMVLPPRTATSTSQI